PVSVRAELVVQAGADDGEGVLVPAGAGERVHRHQADRGDRGADQRRLGAAVVVVEVHVQAFHLQRHGRGAEEVQERVGGQGVLDTAADGPAGLEVVPAAGEVLQADASAVIRAGGVGETTRGVHEGPVEGVTETTAD